MTVHRFRLAAVAAAIFAASCLSAPASAQNTEAQVSRLPPRIADMAPFLARVQYDPGERGPLFVVAPPQQFSIKRDLPGPNDPGATPLMLADAFERRIFKAGAITIIAPREMTVVNTKPGKANPLLNLRPEERLKALLGTLTEAQWQIAGSQGLSQTDLNDDQAALMQGTWPDITSVQKIMVKTNPDKPNETRWEPQGDPTPIDASRLRLRLSRIATYIFQRQDGNQMNYLSGTHRSPRDGETIWTAHNGNSNQGEDRTSAFGVKIMQVVPSRLKRGELDFAASILDAPVGFQKDDGKPLETVGDLLKNVSAATKLDIRADRRVAGLPLFVRAASGQTVRVGDALMALAYGVTGAYRRLSPRQFLLTDDVQGIGTRFAHLQAWAEAAETERREMLNRIAQQAAKNRPLRFIGFNAGFGALPDDVAGKIEKAWEKSSYGPGLALNTSEMPKNLQQDAEEARLVWEKMQEPVYLRKDKVTVNMDLKAQWVMPEGGVLQHYSGLDNFDSQFLSQLIPRDPAGSAPAAPASTPANAKKPAVPPIFTPGLARRAVAIHPRTPDEAKKLVQAALTRGFNEIWVRQTLDSDDHAALKATIAAASTARVPVWLMTSLLRNNDLGETEVSIIGETGDQMADRYIANPLYVTHPDWKHDAIWMSDRYRGWKVPSSEAQEKTLTRRLLDLAAVPGIRGMCLTHTTPPGFGGDSQQSDGLISGGELGYSLPSRLRFLDSDGYDPIDLIPNQWWLNVDMALPFFPHEFNQKYKQVGDNWVVDTSYTPPIGVWKRHRDERVRARLAGIYAALREAQPKMPLFVQDRTSEYASTDLGWFGSWDAPERLPRNPPYVPDDQVQAAARAGSDTRLIRLSWDKFGKRKNEETWFIDSVRRTAERTAKPADLWSGIVVDLTPIPGSDALHLINALPPVVKPAAARSQAGR